MVNTACLKIIFLHLHPVRSLQIVEMNSELYQTDLLPWQRNQEKTILEAKDVKIEGYFLKADTYKTLYFKGNLLVAQQSNLLACKAPL